MLGCEHLDDHGHYLNPPPPLPAARPESISCETCIFMVDCNRCFYQTYVFLYSHEAAIAGKACLVQLSQARLVASQASLAMFCLHGGICSMAIPHAGMKVRAVLFRSDPAQASNQLGLIGTGTLCLLYLTVMMLMVNTSIQVSIQTSLIRTLLHRYITGLRRLTGVVCGVWRGAEEGNCLGVWRHTHKLI